MILIKDTYKTVVKPFGNVLYKEKGSKFIGYVFPVENEDQVKENLDNLRKEHHSARHFCYAWQIGKEDFLYRVNDDGEPNNSAGQPIYGQILSKEVTNILVVVVRYFGGTKLGVGGLISAYKTTAELTLNESKIVKKTINQEFKIACEYKDMNIVMRIVKDNKLKIISQNLHLTCEFVVSVRKKEIKKVLTDFESYHTIKIEPI